MSSRFTGAKSPVGGVFPVFGVIAVVVAGILMFGVLTSSCVQVERGTVGVKTHFGGVTGEVLPQGGPYFLLPGVDRVVKVNIQVQPHDFKEIEAASQEMQQVFVTGKLNYHIDEKSATKTVLVVGTDFADKVIDPALADFIKEVVPKYQATQIYQNRDKIRVEAKDKLNENLARYGLVVDDIYLSNVTFSKGYQQAIEDKQTAQQKVETEKQVLEQKKMQAEQKMVDARAEADANLYRAQKQAEANDLLNRSISQALTQYKAVDKWDGKMPAVTGAGASPLIDMGAITGEKPTQGR